MHSEPLRPADLQIHFILDQIFLFFAGNPVQVFTGGTFFATASAI